MEKKLYMTQSETAQEIKNEIDKITSYIRDCEGRTRQGENIPLEGLDKKVSEICLNVEKLSEEEGRKLDASMQKLIFSLDQLAEAIKNHFENTSEDVK